MPDSQSEAGATPSSAHELPSASYRRYALGVLTVVYVINFVDRQILSILLQPIKLSFDLSDTQLGFLSGIAFAVFYATLGIPIAMWADRGNRRNIVTMALAVFSVMTVLSGMAQNFYQLLLARIGVGVGEAGASPPSHSMIADLYPPEERATAMGTFALGVNIGILIGFLIGGWISEFFGWRVAFMVVGIPGLMIAIVVRLTLREPVRGLSEGRASEARGEAPPIGEAFATVWRVPSLFHISIAAALNAFVGYGAVTWLPSFLARSYGMAGSEIGTVLALLLGIGGGIGTYAGGVLADRLGKRDVRWNLWLVAIAVVGAMPFTFGVYLSTTSTASLLFFIVPALAGTIYLGPSLALYQALAPLRMRTVASAILLFIINIIGLGFGPQTVGVVSDMLTAEYGQEALRYALLIVGFINIWSGFHFWMASRTLKQDLAAAQAAAAE